MSNKRIAPRTVVASERDRASRCMASICATSNSESDVLRVKEMQRLSRVARHEMRKAVVVIR